MYRLFSLGLSQRLVWHLPQVFSTERRVKSKVVVHSLHRRSREVIYNLKVLFSTERPRRFKEGPPFLDRLFSLGLTRLRVWFLPQVFNTERRVKYRVAERSFRRVFRQQLWHLKVLFSTERRVKYRVAERSLHRVFRRLLWHLRVLFSTERRVKSKGEGRSLHRVFRRQLWHLRVE